MIASITRARAGVLLAALAAAPALPAAEVAGVRFDDRLQVGDSELVLNGAGLRSKLFVKVYAAALYAPYKSGSAAVLVDSGAARRLALRLLRDVDADSLYSALHDGLRDNCSPAQWAAIQPQVEQMAGIMRGIGQARSGDSVALDFSAEGVAVSHNGVRRGQVAGAAFAKAVLQVWLGARPVDAGLKEALLGS